MLPLLALELALQSFGPFLPGNYIARLYLEPHPLYGYFHVPNSSGWLKTDEYLTRVEINSRGLREREIEHPKPAGVRRIFVVGDSFVEGAEVAVEATLTRQLEQLLNGAQETPVEVINGGVRAFATDQEYLYLKHEALHYDPDLIILVAFPGNDVAGNSYRIGERPTRRKPYFRITSSGELEPLPFKAHDGRPNGWLGELQRGSMLLGLLDSGVMAKLRGRDSNHTEADGERVAGPQVINEILPTFSERPSPKWMQAWQITEALLVAMRDEAARAGPAFVLVNAPVKWEVYTDIWEEFRRQGLTRGLGLEVPRQRMAEIASRHSIQYLDLRPALRQTAATGTRVYFLQDGHWTAAGHAAAARAIAERLSSGASSFVDSETVRVREPGGGS